MSIRSWLPIRPRRWRRPFVLAAGGTLVPILVFAGLYVFLLVRGSPAPFSLSPTPAPGPAAPGSGRVGATVSTPAGTASGAAALAGRWTVAAGEAGYRIREKLARLPAPSDAVGRTSDVTGQLTLADAAGGGLVAHHARFKVDLTTLRSDESSRDEKVFPLFLEPGNQGTPQFPAATLAVPSVSVPAAARSGTPVTLPVSGSLTIRGVTRDATFRLQARLTGTRIELTGSTTFPLTRYGIATPDFGDFVKLDPNLTVEFHVFLEHH